MVGLIADDKEKSASKRTSMRVNDFSFGAKVGRALRIGSTLKSTWKFSEGNPTSFSLLRVGPRAAKYISELTKLLRTKVVLTAGSRESFSSHFEACKKVQPHLP